MLVNLNLLIILNKDLQDLTIASSILLSNNNLNHHPLIIAGSQTTLTMLAVDDSLISWELMPLICIIHLWINRTEMDIKEEIIIEEIAVM